MPLCELAVRAPEPARQRFTFDEYVRLEEMSTVKHEYLDDFTALRRRPTPAPDRPSGAARSVGVGREWLRRLEQPCGVAYRIGSVPSLSSATYGA
jgi:hypothetical protein